MLVGCEGKSSAERLREAGFDPASQAISFRGIADTLNSLDASIERIDYTRDVPDVIADAATSTDKEPLLAVVADRPEARGDFSYVFVPRKNIDFAARGVRAGDIAQLEIELPVISDEAGPADKPRRQRGPGPETEANPQSQPLPGLFRRQTIRAQVVALHDAHTLRITPPLPTSIDVASPLVVTRGNDRRVAEVEKLFEDWKATGKPAVGWEPTPDSDALYNLVIRLNTWLESDKSQIAWTPDPFIAALPEKDRGAYADIGAEQFAPTDGRLLQEAVWLRDIARRATTAGSAAEQATRMFDWLVENVEIIAPDATLGIRQRPWQTLLFGRGTAEERAWVFVLVLRQLNIDAALIALPGENGQLDPWAVAVQSGKDWLLFDLATGKEIKKDDGASANLKRGVALIEASAFYTTRRAHRVESQLAGAQRIVFTASPSRIAAAIKPHVSEVRLWPIEQQTTAAAAALSTAARAELVERFHVFQVQPYLWKGRVLQFKHDRQRVERDDSDRLVRRYAESQDARVYFAVGCRPSDAELAKLNPAQYHVDQMRLAKRLATVWLGLVAVDDGDDALALDYFANLAKADDKAPLAALVRLNLARTHERIAKKLRTLADQFAPPPAADAPWFPSPQQLVAIGLRGQATEHETASLTARSVSKEEAK